MTIIVGSFDRTGEFLACTKLYQQRALSGRLQLKSRTSARRQPTNGVYSSEFRTTSASLSHEIGMTQRKLEKLCLLLSSDTTTLSYSDSLNKLIDVIQCDILDLNKSMSRLKIIEQSSHGEHNFCPQRLKHQQLVLSGVEFRLASLVSAFQQSLELSKTRISHQSNGVSQSVHRHNPSGYEPNPTVLQYPSNKESSSLAHTVPYACTSAQTSTGFEQSNLHPPHTQNPVINRSASYPTWQEVDKQMQNTTEQSKPFLYPAASSSINLYPPMESGTPACSDHVGLTQGQIQLIVGDQQVRQRDMTMKRVESTIIQLGEIYQQFSNLVQEQCDIITRIDSHTEETELNVSFAHEHLLSFLRTVSARRSFMIKVFITIFLCFVIFAWLK